PIAEPALVLPTISQALGIPDPGGSGALDRLAGQLGGKQVLLGLDNFDQVQAAAQDIGELLAKLPDARVLATSRSPLRVYGEQEYPVPPLELPDATMADPESLSHFASVALFVERAMAVRPDFAVDASNAPAIAQICVSLDGLPLAIELAAARVRVLTPQAMLSRLGDRLSIVAGGASNLPERQQ